MYAVNFPSAHGSAGADVMDGCCYKSTELSMHAGGGAGCSTSSASSLLLDQQQRQHVCGTPSAAAAAGAGSMLPSFGFTQEQVRACRSVNHSVSAAAAARRARLSHARQQTARSLDVSYIHSARATLLSHYSVIMPWFHAQLLRAHETTA